MTITYEVAMAAGRDAGNTSMRKAGRTKWSRQDFAVASAVFNKLMGQA